MYRRANARAVVEGCVLCAQPKRPTCSEVSTGECENGASTKSVQFQLRALQKAGVVVINTCVSCCSTNVNMVIVETDVINALGRQRD